MKSFQNIYLPLFIVTLFVTFGLTRHVDAALVSYWKFDEGTGTDALDSSGNGNNAVVSDDLGWITGKVNGALHFDGRIINTGNTIGNDFSICAWIRTTSVGYGYAHWTLMQIFDAEVGGLGDDFGFGIDPDGYLGFGTGGGYDATINGSIIVNDGQWHHVCATRKKSTGTAKLYVDGRLDAAQALSSGHTLSANNQVLIGGTQDGGYDFTGDIDDVRVYNTVLERDDIRSLAGVPRSYGASYSHGSARRIIILRLLKRLR